MTLEHTTTTVAPLTGDTSQEQIDKLSVTLDRAAGLSRTLATMRPNDLEIVPPSDLWATLDTLADLIGDARNCWGQLKGVETDA